MSTLELALGLRPRRFGASRAYSEIVQLRLQTIGERPVEGFPTWSSFLARRMAPAMRTCLTTEERQATLSQKLARAANLLRTRVGIVKNFPSNSYVSSAHIFLNSAITSSYMSRVISGSSVSQPGSPQDTARSLPSRLTMVRVGSGVFGERDYSGAR